MQIEKKLLAIVRQPLVTLVMIGTTLFLMGMLAVTGSAWYWLAMFASAFATVMVVKALPYNHLLRNFFRNYIIGKC